MDVARPNTCDIVWPPRAVADRVGLAVAALQERRIAGRRSGDFDRERGCCGVPGVVPSAANGTGWRPGMVLGRLVRRRRGVSHQSAENGSARTHTTLARVDQRHVEWTRSCAA